MHADPHAAAPVPGQHLPLTPIQLEKVAGLCMWMRFVGAFQIAVAACVAMYFAFQLFTASPTKVPAMSLISLIYTLPIFAAGGFVWQGLLLQQAADYFKRLEEHEDDQDYLVNAMARLHRAFVIEPIALGLLLVDVMFWWFVQEAWF